MERKGKIRGTSQGKPPCSLATVGATMWQYHVYHHGQVGKEQRQMALGSKGRCGWAPLGRTGEGLQGGLLRTVCSESQSLKLGRAPGALLTQSLIL